MVAVDDDLPQNVAEVLQDPDIEEKFNVFLKAAWADESLKFLRELRKYDALGASNNASVETLLPRAEFIIDLYVKDMSDEQVNISHHMVLKINETMEKKAIGNLVVADLINIFEDAKGEIKKLLERNFYATFMKTLVAEKKKEAYTKNLEMTWRYTGFQDYCALTKYLAYSKKQNAVFKSYLAYYEEVVKANKESIERVYKGRSKEAAYECLDSFLSMEKDAKMFSQVRLPKMTWIVARILNFKDLQLKVFETLETRMSELLQDFESFLTMFDALDIEMATTYAPRAEKMKEKWVVLENLKQQLEEMAKQSKEDKRKGKLQDKNAKKRFRKLHTEKLQTYTQFCQIEDESAPVMDKLFQDIQTLELSRNAKISSIFLGITNAQLDFIDKQNRLLVRFIKEISGVYEDIDSFLNFDVYQGQEEYSETDLLEGALVFDMEDLDFLRKQLGMFEEGTKWFLATQAILLDALKDGLMTVPEHCNKIKDKELELQAEMYPATKTKPSLEKALDRIYYTMGKIDLGMLDIKNEAFQALGQHSVFQEEMEFVAAESYKQAIEDLRNEAIQYPNEVEEYRKLKRQQVSILKNIEKADDETAVDLFTQVSKIEEAIDQHKSILWKADYHRELAVEAKSNAINKMMKPRLDVVTYTVIDFITVLRSKLDSLSKAVLTLSDEVDVDTFQDIEKIASQLVFVQDEDYFKMAMTYDLQELHSSEKSKKKKLAKTSSFISTTSSFSMN